MNETVNHHITNTFSTLFGRFADRAFPPFFQKLINYGYVRLLGLDMTEFDSPAAYPTLNRLFTRALKAPRPFDADEKTLISPCDAMITAAGKLEGNIGLQIKGMHYTIDELLEKTSEEAILALHHGEYLNFYLSPRDYHRYHAPLDMTIERAVHVPGKLYPVNERYLNKQTNLFVENERVILQCTDKTMRRFFLVFVGALNVGRIVLDAIPGLCTNKPGETVVYDLADIPVKKGDELGRFEMGSTIVALFPEKMLYHALQSGEHVRFAQTIGRMS
jgi:phosphatidylserine decarboxylase